jgi:multimeric flavodoxin WrbA
METSDSTGLIIFGSSRSTGNTYDVSKKIAETTNFDLVDLKELNISAYDYDHHNLNDDFIPVAEKMIRAKVILLISPVYWYSMSSQMKTFIDRWSDLVTVRKDLGRRLKGTKIIAVSCSNDNDMGKGFSLPFSQTAEYMDMEFVEYFHVWKSSGMKFESEALMVLDRIIKKSLNLIKN